MKMDANFLYIPLAKEYYHLAKNTLDGIWSAKHQSWKFPKSVHVLDELQRFLPFLGKVAAFSDLRQSLADSRNRLKDIKHAESIQTEGDCLRAYQRQDVQYLQHLPSAGVFNQPRTGKTPTMIETIKARYSRRIMIICPASLQLNWIKEINKWHPEASTYAYSGTPKNREKALDEFKKSDIGYLVLSKDVAKRDKGAFFKMKFDVLAVDEAHFLRNRDTVQSEAIYALGKQAEHRYALTGTPTVKHPSDIFGILHFLYPEKFPSYWQFVERYFQISDNGFGREIGNPIPHRQAELQDLIDAISTQRLRKDVMQWLPDKQRHRHSVHMCKKQQKAYKEMAEDFITSCDDGTELDAENVLAQLMRLRQICLDPRLVNVDAPSAKTDALIEALENNTYDEPIIIMSMFTSYLNLLKPMIEKLGKRVGMITGQLSNADKEGYARAFQRGEIDVLLCNIISAGTGFTLDRGEVIIFTDKAWNPSDNEQAEDRITPTQKDRVHKHFIVSMVCENAIDAHIETILERKESLTAIINQCKTVDQFRLLLL